MNSNRKRAVAIASAGLIVSIPMLSGCMTVASSQADMAEAVASEEAATSADAAVADGGSAAADGSATGEAEAAIPAEWPAVLPVYKGGTLVTASAADDATDANAVWLSTDTYDVAAKDYGKLLLAAGFTLDTDTTSAGLAGGEYSGNGFAVSVSAFDAGGTQLAVSASQD